MAASATIRLSAGGAWRRAAAPRWFSPALSAGATAAWAQKGDDETYVYFSPYRPVASIAGYLPKDHRLINRDSFAVAQPLTREQVNNWELEPANPRDLLNVRRTYERFREQLMRDLDPDRGAAIKLANGQTRLVTTNVLDEKNRDEYPYRITYLSADGTPTGHDIYRDFDEIALALWGHHRDIVAVEPASASRQAGLQSGWKQWSSGWVFPDGTVIADKTGSLNHPALIWKYYDLFNKFVDLPRTLEEIDDDLHEGPKYNRLGIEKRLVSKGVLPFAWSGGHCEILASPGGAHVTAAEEALKKHFRIKHVGGARQATAPILGYIGGVTGDTPDTYEVRAEPCRTRRDFLRNHGTGNSVQSCGWRYRADTETLSHYTLQYRHNGKLLAIIKDWLEARGHRVSRVVDVLSGSAEGDRCFDEAHGDKIKPRRLRAAKLSLQKLRRLFDDGARGMIDEALLDEVYSEWFQFLKRALAQITADMTAWEEDDTDAQLQGVQADLAKAIELLDNRYAANPRDKLLALNQAIQVWHRDVPIIEHYLRSYYNAEVREFLDWLSSRRSFDERRPPRKPSANRTAKMGATEKGLMFSMKFPVEIDLDGKGCAMALLSGQAEADVLALAGQIADADLYHEPDAEYGREDEPHITVFYGLTTAAQPVFAALRDLAPPTVTLGPISLFENADKPYDVVKIEVTSDDLRALHAALSDLPHETDFPDYTPHCTLAYVKKGAGAKYAGNHPLRGRTLTLDEIVYSPPHPRNIKPVDAD